MALQNVQAEFGIAVHGEGRTGDAGTRTGLTVVTKKFTSALTNVVPPRLIPVERVVEGFVRTVEVVGYEPVSLTFDISTFPAHLLRNAGRDRITQGTTDGTATEAPYVILDGVLKDSSGQKASRVAYYAEGRFEVEPQPWSREGAATSGGMQVVQRCSIAGCWELPKIASEEGAMNIADIATHGDDAQKRALWYYDSNVSPVVIYMNGENIVQEMEDALGLPGEEDDSI